MKKEPRRFTVQWDALDPWDVTYPHLWIKAEHLARYIFAVNYLRPFSPSAVADAGTGTGYGANELATIVENVVAIDADEEILQAARNASLHSNITYLRCELGVQRLTTVTPAGGFSAIVSFETLEHNVDPHQVLRDFRAVIKQDGRLILSVPNGINEQPNATGLLSNRLHKRSFSISSIREILNQNGFSVLEVLGQPTVADIARNEARLIRQGQVDGRIGDEPALHQPEMIRRLALTVGYPESRDVERSYSIIVVAEPS